MRPSIMNENRAGWRREIDGMVPVDAQLMKVDEVEMKGEAESRKSSRADIGFMIVVLIHTDFLFDLIHHTSHFHHRDYRLFISCNA